MFELEAFLAACYAALQERSPQAAVKEVVERSMARPGEVEAALGTPAAAQLGTLHRSAELTVLNVIWAPGMAIYPHDHRMWAVIGIYGGQEDNTFYRRGEGGLRGPRFWVSPSGWAVKRHSFRGTSPWPISIEIRALSRALTIT